MGHLPARPQQELRRLRYAAQVRRGTFRSREPEFDLLARWVRPGDVVLDVGANVGHYTMRLSGLTGVTGHVIAIEPVLENAELLTANAALLPMRNVTVLNLAASDEGGLSSVVVPVGDDGLPNYYRSQLAAPGRGAAVLTVALDSLGLPPTVTLIKVDVEGHELAALTGMRALIARDHPALIVEGESPAVEALLADLGYAWRQIPGSPNRIFE